MLFGKKERKKIAIYNSNGWTTIQEADAKAHVLEINCLTENGKVTLVKIRHNDGEESNGKVLYQGKDILPVPIIEFTRLYNAGELEIK